ncbi:MAG: glutaredoxin family protein [Mailhella sp.]|nr:glutaredoxin family protein [Mailhella sp.]
MPASDCISMSIVIAVLVLAGTALVFFLSRKSSGGQDSAAANAEPGQSRDREEEYRLGMDPCACGAAVMYTLQTCLHCVHLKHFLDEHGIECRLVYVDDFEGEQRRELMQKVRSFNPRGSFPTLVLPDGRVSVGFREAQVRQLLGLDQ